MRKWFKYRLLQDQTGRIYEAIDHDFDDHQKAIGGYVVDQAYKSKDAFFGKYYFGYRNGRLENYADFLKKHLAKHDKILSIGSGRCANEIDLLEERYQVVCSDLAVYKAVEAAKILFPSLDFTVLDIINEPAKEKYDKVMALSLIYLFDDEKLQRFFFNVSESLQEGGGLIVEIPGLPDNFIGNLCYHYYLKLDLLILKLIRVVLKKSNDGVVIKHHGYLRRNEEFINFADKFGFGLVDQTGYGFLGDLYGRSTSLQLFFKFARFLAKPKFHARMFFFRKKIKRGVQS